MQTYWVCHRLLVWGVGDGKVYFGSYSGSYSRGRYAPLVEAGGVLVVVVVCVAMRVSSLRTLSGGG